MLGEKWASVQSAGTSAQAKSAQIGLPNLSLLETLKGGLQGSPVAVGLDEQRHEHGFGQIRVAEAVKKASILGEPVPPHRSHKLLFSQIGHS